MHTPPEVAKLMRVSRDKVLDWIRDGQLPALNVAKPGRRPRYRITDEGLELFKTRISVDARPQPARKRPDARPPLPKVYV
jgi:excisionase family DNA binding protein